MHRSAMSLSVALLSIVAATAVVYSSPPYRATLRDEGVSTACGPIACFVAARALGAEVTLDGMIESCQWTEGRLVSLNRLCQVLRQTESVQAEAVRMSPIQLRDTLRGRHCAVILAVRKSTSEVDHAVVAVSADDLGVTILDYPGLNEYWDLDELATRWDGVAILAVQERGAASVGSLLKRMPITIGLLVIVLASISCRVFKMLFFRRAKTPSESDRESDSAHKRKVAGASP